MTPASFGGFPNSGLATAVPNLFFSEVMPDTESVEELIVSVYFFYAAGQARHTPRYVTLAELEADRGLITALARLAGGDAQEALQRGLDLAVRRGSLLQSAPLTVGLASSDAVGRAPTDAVGRAPTDAVGRAPTDAVGRVSNPTAVLFAVNTPANRAALSGLAPETNREAPLPPAEPSLNTDIFTLYEQNIGAITPLIADDLRDAEERYPQEWLRAAIREAAEANKRSWRYIASILRRWETEGPDYEKPERDPEREWLARRYVSGKRHPRTTAGPR